MQLIDFNEAKTLIDKYAIPLPRTVFASSEKEKNVAIKSFKYPLFLKTYGKNILHRTEANGVVEVKNRAELNSAFLRMMKIKGVDGVLFQEKLAGKVLIIGMKRDPQFGPVVLTGIGGIFAEAIKDVSLRVAPVSIAEAMKMISELKGYDYLSGKRDKKQINFKAVAEIIVAISKLSLTETDIKEIDINPVFADGKRAVAIDFKFLK